MIFTSGLYQNWAQAWFHLARAPYSGKAHSLGCLPYNRCALKNPLSEKDFFNRRLLFGNWPLCLTMYVSWWSCSLIVIVLFCRQEACFTLRASFLTRNTRGQFALVMLIFFWGSLLWTSFWPWKLLHPTKALMCSRSSRLLVFRLFHNWVRWHSHMKTFLAWPHGEVVLQEIHQMSTYFMQCSLVLILVQKHF